MAPAHSPPSGGEAPEFFLQELNPPQREAVTHGEGPLLVLAGAGSGKTRVLTQRIGWLVAQQGVDPGAILALTFTNKAARQMSERVQALLGTRAERAWIGTFHGIALRILRNHVALLPSCGPFTLYDADDQLRLAKQVVKELNVDPKRYRPASLLTGVQRAKDDGKSLADFTRPTDNPYAAVFYDFFVRYQKRLREAKAFDFADLLLETIHLFEAHPEVAKRYASRFRYVLIDEYQDTNHVQYRLAQALSAQWGNLMVVGDDDQSIYGWRGADLRNILEFEEAFPGTKVVKLEQNYRSTSAILEAASTVIDKNRGRHDKTLWTAREGGDGVRLHAAATEEEEAGWIVREAIRLHGLGKRYADIAVLFMHNEGYSTMCGHGIIAVVTVGIETGMFAVDEDEPVLRIDKPAGRVTARAPGIPGGSRSTRSWHVVGDNRRRAQFIDKGLQ